MTDLSLETPARPDLPVPSQPTERHAQALALRLTLRAAARHVGSALADRLRRADAAAPHARDV